MDVATDIQHPTPESADAAVPDESAPAPMLDWEAYIKESFEGSLIRGFPDDENSLAQIAVLRDLVRQCDGELREDSVGEAAQKIRDLYRDAYLDDGAGYHYQREADHGAEAATWSLCEYTWDLAWQFSETDVRHTALASLLAAVKKASPPVTFDPKDPQLVFSHKGLENISVEQFDKGYVRNIGPDDNGIGLVNDCYRSIRSFAFRGKLQTMGVFDTSDLRYSFLRMNDYLIENEKVNDLAWSARIATAAQPILFSGEAMVEEAKQPTQTHWLTLDAKKWQSFALQLKTESQSERQDRWGAKDKAARAYARMVDLWPEAFET